MSRSHIQTLSAYHGSEEVKAKYVNRMKAHIEADELDRGIGFENGRGCAVGCTLNKYDHSAFPSELGIPEWAAYLLDTLHENTSDDVWPTLSLRFLCAIKPGANLEPVRNHIHLFILRRNRERVESLKKLDKAVQAQVIAAIDQCIELHARELQRVIDPAASAARSAASAARSAAWSAESAAWSAESAASAAWSAAWSAESAAEMDAIAEAFIQLLEDV